MDPQILNRNLLNSYTLKPNKKDHLFPYFQKFAQNALHDKKEPNPPKPHPKNPPSKVVSRAASPKTQKHTPQTKLKQRERSISKAVNAYMRDIKDDFHGGLGPRARSLIKNSARSCLPSPTMKQREDITMFHAASKPIVKEFEEKKKSFFIPNPEPKSEARPTSKEPVKKRVRVHRVDNQRPSVLAHESNLDYQMFIANPAIEQELFKEYLGTDRQTFGFEKLVISGSYEQCSSNLELTVMNSKSTVDTNTNISTKPSRMESKLQVLTRDSSNTIGGLTTTNNTSRSKGVVGLLNGLNGLCEKENVDLVELIDWSLEIPNEDNNSNCNNREKEKEKEKAKLPLPLQKQAKTAGGHHRRNQTSLSGQPGQPIQIKKQVKPASASILKVSSSRGNTGIGKLYKDSNKRDVSL